MNKRKRTVQDDEEELQEFNSVSNSDDDEEVNVSDSDADEEEVNVSDSDDDEEEVNVSDSDDEEELQLSNSVSDSDDEEEDLFEPEPEANAANVHIVLTDRKVFDCPICLDQLFTPVFQCENGHIVCSSCFSKLMSKCPFCCMRIDIRCRGLEKFLQSINILCKYAHSGCTKTMPYSKKIDHEQVCQHVTCFCPYPSCSFSCSRSLMYRHLCVQHKLSTTRFTYNTTFSVSVEINQKKIFLQERHGSVVFILHHEFQQHGRAFYVDCVGLSTLKDMFAYHLTAESMDMDTYVTLKSVPEVHTQLPKHTFMKKHLTVPSAFAGDKGILSLSVCIIKDDPTALEVQEGERGLHDPDAHKVLKVVLNDPDALNCSICLECC